MSRGRMTSHDRDRRTLDCDDCGHQRAPDDPDLVPTCAVAPVSSACVLAVEDLLRAHWERVGRWLDRCPRWKARR